MAKKTKKMADGGPAVPMDSRPAMQGSGNSKAGAGQSVKQDGNRPDRKFGPMRGNDRYGDRPSGVRGGRQGDDGGNRPKPDMDRPGMVRPGFGPRPISGAGGMPIGPRGYGPTDGGPMGPPIPKQMVPAPAGVPFKPGMTFDQSLANFGQQYYGAPPTSQMMAQQAMDQQMRPAMKSGGAVKSKKMASGGMAKSSSGGRGWGKARGSKSAKVC